MTRTYPTEHAAHEAIVSHFIERNEARGQYPQRISPKRQWVAINPDGSVKYTYTYKGESVHMLWSCYDTTVTIGE